jgi:hypothetical protein
MSLFADSLCWLQGLIATWESTSVAVRGRAWNDRRFGFVFGFGRRVAVWAPAVFCAASILGAGGRPVGAIEPAEDFLRELQSRGYHDLALEFLDRMETSKTASDEFRQTIDFYQGEVLIQSALRQRVAGRKEGDLDRAQQKFEKFTRERADDVLWLPAQGKLAEIVLERARLFATQVAPSDLDAAPTDPNAVRARQLFNQAAQSFAQYQARLRVRLEQIPTTLTRETDGSLIEERDLLRSEYVEAQFVAAMARYEQALTYAVDSRDRTKRREQSEAAFKVVAEKYRRRVAGLSAVLMQGRCRQMANDPRGALAYFEDLLTLSDGEAALRPLKTKALRGAMECWLDPEVAQYEAARQRAEAWLKQQRPDERADDDWMMIKVMLAETYQKLMELGVAGQGKGELTREARKLAIDAARTRGEAQARAQALLAELGHVTQPVAQTQPMATFDEAMATARDALAQRQIAAQSVAVLQQRLSESRDAASGQEMEQRLAESLAQLEHAETRALDLLRQAQDLVTDETPVEQVNQSRYYLCTMYYYREDFYSAAVLADFLAARFPATEEGRRASAVSLAALVRLYGDGQSSWASAMHQRMLVTAQRIARQWKGQPEADDALATMVTVAVQQGDPAAALEHLQQMSPDSPKLAAAELTVGQALWSSASQGVGSDGDTDRVERQQQQAIELMQQGLHRSTRHGPSAGTLTAALIVGQHLVNQHRADEAIAVLEDATWGPKTLADQQHALLESSELRQRVYLLSTMAYIGGLSESESTDALIDKVLSTLEQVNDASVDEASQQQQLASTYVVLARSLQEQIESAPPERAAALTHAFAELLERAVSSGTDLSILTWAAQSYANLGSAIAAVDSHDATTVQAYYAKAVAVYQDLLRRSDAGDFTMTVQERLLLETRLAAVLREQGRYEEAMDRFVTILKRQPNQVYVQMEAARTLQRWGGDGNPVAYQLAILGDRADSQSGQNLLWGYGRISKLIAGKHDLHGLFYEARYGLAECRYQYAMTLSLPNRREMLKQAEQDIVMTARLYPKLGGAQLKDRYHQLLQQIQQSMGKRPTGLSL